MTDPNDTPDTDASAAPSRNPAKLGLVALVVAVLVGGGWYLYSQGKLPGLGGTPAAAAAAAQQSRPSSRPEDGLRVLAEVNGKSITAEEVAPATINGLDRAVAVDRYVTRLLAAEAANELYPDAAKAAKAAAEREVLSNLFLQRRGAELLQEVTDKDIDQFYKDQVKDADYASYKLNYYLTQDDIDAATMERNIAGGDAEAKAKFKSVPVPGNAADGFIPLAQTPYGLGQLIASAKVGDYLRAVRVRDGFLILHIEQVRPGKKPEQTKDIKDEIRRLIAERRLTDELLERREKAQIKLKL